MASAVFLGFVGLTAALTTSGFGLDLLPKSPWLKYQLSALIGFLALGGSMAYFILFGSKKPVRVAVVLGGLMFVLVVFTYSMSRREIVVLSAPALFAFPGALLGAFLTQGSAKRSA